MSAPSQRNKLTVLATCNMIAHIMSSPLNSGTSDLVVKPSGFSTRPNKERGLIETIIQGRVVDSRAMTPEERKQYGLPDVLRSSTLVRPAFSGHRISFDDSTIVIAKQMRADGKQWVEIGKHFELNDGELHQLITKVGTERTFKATNGDVRVQSNSNAVSAARSKCIDCGKELKYGGSKCRACYENIQKPSGNIAVTNERKEPEAATSSQVFSGTRARPGTVEMRRKKVGEMTAAGKTAKEIADALKVDIGVVFNDRTALKRQAEARDGDKPKDTHSRTGRPPVDKAKVEKAISLVASGASKLEAAEQVGINRNTLTSHIKRRAARANATAESADRKLTDTVDEIARLISTVDSSVLDDLIYTLVRARNLLSGASAQVPEIDKVVFAARVVSLCKWMIDEGKIIDRESLTDRHFI
jgi:DNA-binding CsgD family transcriptional regulator